MYRSLFLDDWFFWVYYYYYLKLKCLRESSNLGFVAVVLVLVVSISVGVFYFFFRDFVVLLMKMSRVLCGRPLVGMNKFCFVFGMKFFPLLC